MRLNRSAVAVSVLFAVLTVCAFGVFSAFASPIPTTRLVKWNDTLGQSVANLPADTTFMTDEFDTTRTVVINTDDWDWSAYAAASGGVATGCIGARITFVASTTNGAGDSLYFSVERGSGRDSVFTYNPVGTVNWGVNGVNCVSLGANSLGTTAVYEGILKIDPDTPGIADNIWLLPAFRLRVFGDVGGATPKLSGLKCYITYLKRQESQ